MKDLDLMEIIFGHYKLKNFELMVKGIILYGRKEFFNDLFGFIIDKHEDYSNSTHLYHMNSVCYWFNKYKEEK